MTAEKENNEVKRIKTFRKDCQGTQEALREIQKAFNMKPTSHPSYDTESLTRIEFQNASQPPTKPWNTKHTNSL